MWILGSGYLYLFGKRKLLCVCVVRSFLILLLNVGIIVRFVGMWFVGSVLSFGFVLFMIIIVLIVCVLIVMWFCMGCLGVVQFVVSIYFSVGGLFWRNRFWWLWRIVLFVVFCIIWRRVVKDGIRYGLWFLKMNFWCCIFMEFFRM